MALIDTKKNSVLFKYNGTPTATDVVNIEENVMISPDVKQTDFKEFDGQLGSTESFIDKEHTTASFSIKAKLRGNDKTGVAPETPPAIADLLKCAGMTETVGLSDVTYTPNHGVISSSQATVYMDGRKRVVDGIVGNFKLSGTVGECAMVEFALQGYTDIAFTSEANPTVTLDSEALMVVNTIQAVTVNGTTFNLKSFDFDLNNEIVDIYAIALAKFERTDFDPKISLTGYEDTTSTAWADLDSEELKTIVITLGNEVGKTVTLTIDSAKPLNNNESDDSGKLSITREFRCKKDDTSGNHYELKWS